MNFWRQIESDYSLVSGTIRPTAACFGVIIAIFSVYPSFFARYTGFCQRVRVDFPWCIQRRQPGRIGEVGPPASGCSFFTVPYSHLAVLNGNPALRGWPATAGVTDEGKRMADETKPTRKGSPPIKVVLPSRRTKSD
ncbi:hypothetical protein EfaeDRAFT_0412 [Enterococcus faecium DO]|nr:hypothetical protein EfaeDRAFT_0412 [Enterococcus faecium DO]